MATSREPFPVPGPRLRVSKRGQEWALTVPAFGTLPARVALFPSMSMATYAASRIAEDARYMAAFTWKTI